MEPPHAPTNEGAGGRLDKLSHVPMMDLGNTLDTKPKGKKSSEEDFFVFTYVDEFWTLTVL